MNRTGQVGTIGQGQDGIEIQPGGISVDVLNVAPTYNQDGLQSSGCVSSMEVDERTLREGKTTKGDLSPFYR